MSNNGNHIMKKVLCLDPDENTLAFLRGLLQENGYHPITTTKSGEAVQLLMEHSPALVIMELHLSDSPAEDFIKTVRRTTPSSVVLMYTAQKDRRQGADRRLGNVFEYVEKGAQPELIISHLARAYSFHSEKKATIYFETDHEDRMRYQLEWLLWKQKTRLEEKMHFTGKIIESIKHSITQGMGVGSIITLADLMNMKKEETGDGYYRVHSSLVDSIVASSHMLHRWLQGLDTIGHEFSREHPQEILEPGAVDEAIQQSISQMAELSQVKSQKISLDSGRIHHSVIGNREVITMAMRELLSNAFKYSPESSSIDVLRYRTGNGYTIAVVNDIIRMEGGVTGLPEDQENQIFEPFFRLNNIFDERFQEGRSGLGLGLTLVQKAISETGGQMFVREVVDHLSAERKKRIIAEIVLPVSLEESIVSNKKSEGQVA